MPTYEYICDKGHRQLQERSIKEEQTEFTCAAPLCDASIKQVYSTPAAIFKGSGFYKTGG